MREKLDLIKQENLAVCREKNQHQAVIEANNAKTRQIEQSLKMLEQYHEDEMSTLNELYTDLEKQVDDYHNNLFATMGICTPTQS